MTPPLYNIQYDLIKKLMITVINFILPQKNEIEYSEVSLGPNP